MLHARVIPAGKCLYAIGHAGKLLVAKTAVPLLNFKKRIPGPPFFAGDPGNCFSGKTQIRV